MLRARVEFVRSISAVASVYTGFELPIIARQDQELDRIEVCRHLEDLGLGCESRLIDNGDVRSERCLSDLSYLSWILLDGMPA